jgi:sugar phosphate isomerase/epimerase
VAHPRVLASTTSHKREPLLPTLEIFSRLGLCDIDLNLHHVLELGTSIDSVADAVDANGLHVWGLAGGWCDFFHPPPEVDATMASVSQQVRMAARLDVRQIRLFFGRVTLEDYSQARRERVCDNLLRLSDSHHDRLFVFENHDGASRRPEICAEILERVNRPNIRMNFDPINFERDGVASMAALEILHPYIGHVHLKGLDRGEFCEFGLGDVDLQPVLARLAADRYTGRFSVEYEGANDGTLRLYQSVHRANVAIDSLFATNPIAE